MKNQIKDFNQKKFELWTDLKPVIRGRFVVCFLFICFSTMAWSQESQAPKDTKPSAELHLLKNTELIKQAETVIQQASNTFLADLRGLSKNEILYQRAFQTAQSFQLPELSPIPEDAPPLEQKRLILDQAKTLLEARQKHLALLETEKQSLDVYITQIVRTQSAATLLLNAFEKIDIFLWEIQLRLGDQTLSESAVPASLEADHLTIQSQAVQDQPSRLAQQLEQAQETLKTTVQRIQDAQKAILEAQAQYTASEEIHSQELKRHNLEQDYLKHPPHQLLRQLATSQEALVGLHGTYNLSHRRFDRIQARVNEIQKELESLSPPESPETQEPNEQGEQRIQAMVTYHETRVELLRNLKKALTTLLNQEKSFQADEVVLREQLFSMQVLANVLESLVKMGVLPQEELPETELSQTLLARMEATNKIRTKTLSVVNRAKEQLTSLDQQIDNSLTARKDARDRLFQLQEAREAAKQAQQWDAELKELDTPTLIQRFNDSTAATQKNATELNATRADYEQLQIETQRAKGQLDSLEDPLLRSTEQKYGGEYETILKTLFGYAELEQTESIQIAPASTSTETPSITDSKVPSEAEKPAFDIRQYQNLLSTQIRILDEQKASQSEFLASLKKLEEKTGHYTSVFKEASTLALQRYGIAIEIRKRLGQQELQSHEVPEGVTEALQRERILLFEKQAAEFANQQTHLQQQIEFLSQPDDTLQERQRSLKQILESIGKRLDIREDQQQLAKELAAGRAALSEIEVKTLHQDAIRLQESETPWQESLLGFVPSDRAANLVDLMRAYYQEWIELGSDQENLLLQTEKMDRLIQLLDEEKTAVSELQPFLQQQVAQLTAAYEEEEVRIHARLMPQKAEELLENFETKTGRRLSAPPPLPKENPSDAIVEHAKQLFEQSLQIAAARQWIQLFEQRLSTESLGAELGGFQQELGDLNIKMAAVERRLQFLKGHSPEELSQLSPEDAPQTELEEIRFLNGEVGVLRFERNQTLQQEVLWVLGQIGVIVVGAMFLILVVNLSIGQLMKRAKSRNANAHTLFVLSFFNAFLKLAIWITAIIFVFSALGFQVGAILAGLGIGGLAIAMAARETLANILGGIMIFFERPFTIGDVIYVRDRPAKVVGMTWRTTRFVIPAGYSYCVPNSQLTESTIWNFSHNNPPEDFLDLYLSAQHDPRIVVPLILQAARETDGVLGGVGGRLNTVTTMGNMTVAVYLLYWQVEDYQTRLGIRARVWQRIWVLLHEEGIEMEVKPFPSQQEVYENPKGLPEEIA